MNENQNIDENSKEEKYKKRILIMWGIFITGVLSVITLFVILSFTDLPTFEELEDPRSDEATQVFADDGSILGRFYVENRVAVSYADLSPYLVDALVSTEDERYIDHSGIDFKAFGRAMVKTAMLGDKSAGGASTITQQLAKLLFTVKSSDNIVKRIFQKLKEWIIAVRLERQYTKEEIMTMYLNKFNFINGAYGIKAASEIYFGKPPSDLNLQESATLVGMLKNPSLYNPVRFGERTKKRREVVMFQMKKNNVISQVEYDSLRVLPLEMNSFKRVSHDEGLATYFRIELAKDVKKILKRKEKRRSDGSSYDIYRDGLKIYTSIDPSIQKIAEESVKEHLRDLQGKFNKHWEGKDPWEYEDWEMTDSYKSIRKSSLQRLVNQSERAQKIRLSMTQGVRDTLSNLVDFKIRDADINRILKHEETGNYFAELRKKDYIGEKLEKIYRNILKKSEWKKLKNQWKKAEKEIEKQFDTEVPMTVYAYNEAGVVDTTMTPLDSLKYIRNFLQAGVLAVDPITGYVRAWVGGADHKQFKYDHVRINRQVGSTFKPLVYATAIAQQGMSPCMQVTDNPYTIHVGESNFDLIKDWTPLNSSGKYSREPYSLFRALQESKNSISVYIMKQLGDVKPVVDLAVNMGISEKKIPKMPSICLGTADLSVMEMTGAYATFANNGTYNKPIFIKRIEDKNGRLIYSEDENRVKRDALSPQANYVMVEMLKKTTHNGKPGFRKVKSEFGGKTGTTNNHVDGWFMGITPNLVVGTWVGGEDNWVRFRTLKLGQGGRMARPIFSKILNGIEQDSTINFDTNNKFAIPTGDIGIEVDCDLYQQNFSSESDSDDDLDDILFGPDADSTETEEDPDDFF